MTRGEARIAYLVTLAIMFFPCAFFLGPIAGGILAALLSSLSLMGYDPSQVEPKPSRKNDDGEEFYFRDELF